MPFRLKPFRGSYYSLTSVPWYFHNAFTYIVRYTFLEFITPTPLNLLFYRMMGMKIGKGAHINTTNISDPALIEIEDKVTIGGSVHIIAHYASKGYLIVERVKIRKGATLGLKATVMGDVEIGEGAVIGAGAVVTRDIPVVHANHRWKINTLPGGLYRCTAYYGFKEIPNIPRLLQQVELPEYTLDPGNVTYFLGRIVLIPRRAGGVFYWRKKLYVLMKQNAQGTLRFFRIPPEQVLEVGMQMEI